MTKNYFLGLAGIVVLLAVAGTFISFKTQYDNVIALTVFSIGICTFFGFIIAGSSGGLRWKFDKSGVRTAIAAAIIVTYLFMVSFIQFSKGNETLTPAKKAYIESFTSVISITIGFYLGGSALVQAFGKDDPTEDKPSEKKD